MMGMIDRGSSGGWAKCMEVVMDAWTHESLGLASGDCHMVDGGGRESDESGNQPSCNSSNSIERVRSLLDKRWHPGLRAKGGAGQAVGNTASCLFAIFTCNRMDPKNPGNRGLLEIWGKGKWAARESDGQVKWMFGGRSDSKMLAPVGSRLGWSWQLWGKLRISTMEDGGLDRGLVSVLRRGAR